MEGAALHSPDLLDVAYLTIVKKQGSNATPVENISNTKQMDSLRTVGPCGYAGYPMFIYVSLAIPCQTDGLKYER